MSVKITLQGLDGLISRFDANRIDFKKMMDGLAKMGRDQTQQRIRVEKTSPDGNAWPKTKDGRAALFVSGNHLYRSMDYSSSGTQAIWGSGWIGARVHQDGAVIKPVNGTRLHFILGGKSVFAKKATVPARPYLGISAQNAADLEDAAVKFIAEKML